MATVSSLGSGSGIDLEGLLTKLMTAEQAPLTALTTKVTSSNARISSLGTLNTPPAAPSETHSLARSTGATELAAAAPVSEKSPIDKPSASEAQLQSAVKAANDFIKPITNSVEFSLDKDSEKMIVKVMDNATKEVIRQIPSVEMLAIAQALDKIQGLLIKQKA